MTLCIPVMIFRGEMPGDTQVFHSSAGLFRAALYQLSYLAMAIRRSPVVLTLDHTHFSVYRRNDRRVINLVCP